MMSPRAMAEGSLEPVTCGALTRRASSATPRADRFDPVKCSGNQGDTMVLPRILTGRNLSNALRKL